MDFSNLDIAMNHEEAHRCELLFEVIWNDINKSKATYFGRRVGVSSYAQYSEKEDSTECRPNLLLIMKHNLFMGVPLNSIFYC